MAKNPFSKILLLLLFLCAFSLVLVWFKGCWWPKNKQFTGGEISPEAVIENYGPEIRKYADELQLPATYFAALCMLESGGRKPVPSRFEKHVYTRLKLVKAGIKGNYEHVTPAHLVNAKDEALQNLASSWGPFQLMGYKCMLFDVKVKDLRGEEGVYWAMKWMDLTYGSYLKKGDFKSAFHIHNAGVPFPKNGIARTHNPNYVNNGLKWMKWFEGKL